MRQAGEFLNLTPALVAYMAEADRTGVQNEDVDSVLADRFNDAFDLVLRPGKDQAAVRTMEYVPGRDDVTVVPLASGADGGDLQARGASFDLSYPKIPGRDLEGIPNANDPVMREKLRQRLLRNPGGREQLPSFLQKA